MPAPSDAAAEIPEPAGTALPPFEVLITHHGAAVLRVCRALVGPVDADDVWQETFLAALRVYPSTGSIRNKEAWLVTIARNKAIDHHRKAKRLPVPAGGLGAGGPGVGEHELAERTLAEHGLDEHGLGGTGRGGGDVVVRSVEAGETATAVWAALATLAPRQREAVVYHHLAGLRYAEVAGILGNSEAAARRAAADGMRALRALLDHERTQKQ